MTREAALSGRRPPAPTTVPRVVRRPRRPLSAVRSIAEVAQRVLLRPVPLTAGPLHAAVSYTS
ncbi:hypothetical protein AB0B09_42180, partial [Streptomyces sp. NPDC044948]